MPSYDLTVKVTMPEGKDSNEAKELLRRVIRDGTENMIFWVEDFRKDATPNPANDPKFEVQ